MPQRSRGVVVTGGRYQDVLMAPRAARSTSWEGVVRTDGGGALLPDPAGRGSAEVGGQPRLHLWL